MSQGEILTVLRDAVLTAAILAAPILIVTAAVGVTISIIQAATQIQEQSVSFILKILAVGLVILLLSSWGITQVTDYMHRIFDMIARVY
ncbi:MAG TPA: flagellar biosynthetic protein FliQ [Bacillota bacterium]|nr:flagellar biosynthetic protein FliQ [Clostridiales bacterium]HPT85459.1 flagellar biosynthetic protein FliQ [Bacillota bacterium]